MNKAIKIALATQLGFLAFLWLEKPLRELMSSAYGDERMAALVASVCVRVTMIAMAIGLLRKLRLQKFTGLHSPLVSKNLQATVIPLAFIAMGITSNWSIYLNTETPLLLWFALSVLAVGLLEELTFRGIIFPLFVNAFRHRSKAVLISALSSSLMFGLIHFFNVFRQPDNLIGISSQVFFATAIGVFFCGLMVRTKNILIPSILHALVNFSFGTGKLKEPIAAATEFEENSGVDWNSLIPTGLFFSFILIGGVYMILKTEKEAEQKMT